MYRFAIASAALLFGGQLAYAQQCDTAGGVVINEIYPNAEGSDTDKEWVEIVNNGQVQMDISGWTLWAGTSSYNTSFELPPGTFIGPGQHIHLGGPLAIPTPQIIYPTGLSMGNAASSCDAIQLRDCNGVVSDTVVYGPNNTDLWLDDNGREATCAPPPNSEQALGRVTSGMDTDNLSEDFDWYAVGDETPGGANWFKIWADTPLTAGAPANVYVRGALDGTTVYFAASLVGEGAGTCYPQLSDTCVDILSPTTLLGNAVSDATRRATFNANVPAQLSGSDVWLQAGVPGQMPYKSIVWMNTIQ